MRLSTKGRYAVTAMVDLARHSNGYPVPLGEIADRQEISLSYLEQLFARLRRNGLVSSVRGPGGGYLLARPAEETCIADIVMAVDGPVGTASFGTGAMDGAQPIRTCPLTHDLWLELDNQVHSYLSSVTLADVIERRILATNAMVVQEETRVAMTAE